MKLEWADLPKVADFVFIALHGGFGENGCMQGALEMIGLPYNGSSVFASSLCMDKYKTCQFLKFKNFDVPENLLISKIDWQNNKLELIEKIKSKIKFPLICKPHDDGCSVMVQKINNQEELENSLELLFNNNKNFALIEELITGMELTVGVIGNENPVALIPSQAIASKGVLSIEEKFLPGQGENQTPAAISKQAENFVRKVMADAYSAVCCKGYARIDCFYQDKDCSPTGKERVVIIEINSLPGMTPATCIFHQAAEMGIKPMDFIDLIIALGFEEHQTKNKLTENIDSASQIISKLNLTNKLIN
jgi:D-alanine-D-alanine ligase